MTDRQTLDAKQAPAVAERDRRRAEALRANLRRRKAARPHETDQPGADTPVDDGGREEG